MINRADIGTTGTGFLASYPVKVTDIRKADGGICCDIRITGHPSGLTGWTENAANIRHWEKNPAPCKIGWVNAGHTIPEPHITS